MDADRKPTLCLDFDGVIHSYASGWRGAHVVPDPPVPGAIEAVLGYLAHFDVAVHSSRFNAEHDAWVQTGSGGWTHPRHAVRDWLAAHGLARDLVEPNGDASPARAGVVRLVATKPAARVTLDDRALTFTGAWPAPEELLSFRPWTRKGD